MRRTSFQSRHEYEHRLLQKTGESLLDAFHDAESREESEASSESSETVTDDDVEHIEQTVEGEVETAEREIGKDKEDSLKRLEAMAGKFRTIAEGNPDQRGALLALAEACDRTVAAQRKIREATGESVAANQSILTKGPAAARMNASLDRGKGPRETFALGSQIDSAEALAEFNQFCDLLAIDSQHRPRVRAMFQRPELQEFLESSVQEAKKRNMKTPREIVMFVGKQLRFAPTSIKDDIAFLRSVIDVERASAQLDHPRLGPAIEHIGASYGRSEMLPVDRNAKKAPRRYLRGKQAKDAARRLCKRCRLNGNCEGGVCRIVERPETQQFLVGVMQDVEEIGVEDPEELAALVTTKLEGAPDGVKSDIAALEEMSESSSTAKEGEEKSWAEVLQSFLTALREFLEEAGFVEKKAETKKTSPEAADEALQAYQDFQEDTEERTVAQARMQLEDQQENVDVQLEAATERRKLAQVNVEGLEGQKVQVQDQLEEARKKSDTDSGQVTSLEEQLVSIDKQIAEQKKALDRAEQQEKALQTTHDDIEKDLVALRDRKPEQQYRREEKVDEEEKSPSKAEAPPAVDSPADEAPSDLEESAQEQTEEQLDAHTTLPPNHEVTLASLPRSTDGVYTPRAYEFKDGKVTAYMREPFNAIVQARKLEEDYGISDATTDREAYTFTPNKCWWNEMLDASQGTWKDEEGYLHSVAREGYKPGTTSEQKRGVQQARLDRSHAHDAYDHGEEKYTMTTATDFVRAIEEEIAAEQAVGCSEEYLATLQEKLQKAEHGRAGIVLMQLRENFDSQMQYQDTRWWDAIDTHVNRSAMNVYGESVGRPTINLIGGLAGYDDVGSIDGSEEQEAEAKRQYEAYADMRSEYVEPAFAELHKGPKNADTQKIRSLVRPVFSFLTGQYKLTTLNTGAITSWLEEGKDDVV